MSREKTIRFKGLAMSHPIALIFALIYILQSATIFYLMIDKFENERLIHYQRSKIEEMEEKLKILEIIEDFEVGMAPSQIGNLTNVIYAQGEKYGYDPLLLLALIDVESSFRREVVSHKGAMGLMQLKPSVGSDVANRRGIDWYNKSMLYNPDYNIELGSLYLFELILKFGDVKDAITAYNLGETRLRKMRRTDVEPPQMYLGRVLKKYKELKEKYDV